MKALRSRTGVDGRPIEWEGYTLEQIEYRRAVALARIELEKRHLSVDAQRAKQGNFMLKPGIFGQVLKFINFADFAVIGFKLLRSISPLFRKKK